MADYSETFVCTAIPMGIEGTTLRLAVVVSPRLGSTSKDDAELQKWPNARALPTLTGDWKVVIDQGAGAHELVGHETSGPYEADAWNHMFPEDQATTPYVPVDRSMQPIASYPVAKVRDALKDLHTSVLADARTSFPSVDYLEDHPVFQALQDAARHELTAIPQDPPTDASTGLGDAFRQLEGGVGVRPGSVGTPPTVTGVTPNPVFTYGGQTVVITGTGFIGVEQVYFGVDAAVSFTVDSRTQISAVTPDVGEVILVPVVVKTAAGTSDQDPDTAVLLNFTPPPEPVVTGVVPPSITHGSPDNAIATVAINGANFKSTYLVQFVFTVASGRDPLLARSWLVNATGDQITVEVPHAAEPSNVAVPSWVQVTTQGGNSAIDTSTPNQRFTYFQPGGPH